jgi:hypothetical protein
MLLRHPLGLVILAAFFVGCGLTEDKAKKDGASSVERALEVTIDGKPVKLPLDQLELYVVALSANQTETFELHGPSVMLAGALPKNHRVGFDAHYDELFAHPIPILPQGGNPAAPKNSKITLPGSGTFTVTGGTFTLESTFGTYADDKGARGKVHIEMTTPSGPRTLDGTFVTQIITRG